MFEREIWEKILPEITSKEVIVLTGPRQVGKTTTLKWVLNKIESQNKIYLDLEVLSNRDLFSHRNYDLVLSELKSLGLNQEQKMYIALDEIQLVENLPSVIKYLHDNYNVKFFLSGSSSYYLKNHFSESMAGRKLIYEVHPLSFKEFLRFKDVRIPEFTSFSEMNKISLFNYERLKNLYQEYVEFGGMPKVVMEDDYERKRALLNEIYTSYIRLDVETLADFKSISDFRTLINLLASRIGNKVDISKLSLMSGLSRPTIYTYLEFLEQTYIIRFVEPFSKSKDVKSKIPRKIYFIDTGIANINADNSEGAKFENTICHQLSFYGDLTYFSDKYSEIDFIVNNKVGFEVKVTPTIKDEKTLKRNAEKLKLENYYLLGKNYNGTYDKFIYAGMI